MAKILDVADGLVTELNAALSLGEDFRRVFRPAMTREEMATLQLLVVPMSETRDGERHSRKRDRKQFAVELAVQQAVDSTDNDAVDALVDQVEAIADLWGEDGALRHKQISGASFSSLENDPLWDATRLIKHDEFVSVIRLAYKIQG